jgi:hypothetical protein
MPDVSTEVAIATQTLGTAAASITFSSIPGTYTDLRLVLTEFSSNTATTRLRFNGDSGANYASISLYGTGTAVGTVKQGSDTGIWLDYYSGGSTTIPLLQIADIFSYTGSTKKTILVNGNADKNGSGAVERIAGLWSNTAVITSITAARDSGNYNAGTIATLYGIL